MTPRPRITIAAATVAPDGQRLTVTLSSSQVCRLTIGDVLDAGHANTLEGQLENLREADWAADEVAA